MALTTYYDILNISPKASDEDVQQAYRRLAMRWHPDRNPRNRQRSEVAFRQIHRAYLILQTQERRNIYNRVLLRYLRSPDIVRQRRKASRANRPGMLYRFSGMARSASR